MAQLFIANTGLRDIQLEINGTLYQLDGKKQTEKGQENASKELALALGIDDLSLTGVRPLGN